MKMLQQICNFWKLTKANSPLRILNWIIDGMTPNMDKCVNNKLLHEAIPVVVEL